MGKNVVIGRRLAASGEESFSLQYFMEFVTHKLEARTIAMAEAEAEQLIGAAIEPKQPADPLLGKLYEYNDGSSCQCFFYATA